MKNLGVAILLFALATTASGQEVRRALSKPVPHYPDIAKQMHLSGTVKVEIVIAPDGRVKETKALGGHPLLVDSVLATVKEWKYEPAKTETSTVLTFDFHP